MRSLNKQFMSPMRSDLDRSVSKPKTLQQKAKAAIRTLKLLVILTFMIDYKKIEEEANRMNKRIHPTC
jgi:hypothetical protein